MGNELARILVVDDDPGVLDMVKETLEDSGHFRVFVASSGTEAYAKVRNLNIDLMVTDIRMPTMNGMELVEVIQSTYKLNKLPIVFLSGNLELLSENIKQRPLTEFIGKPFDPEVLIKAALDLLRRRKLHEMSKVDLDVQILNSFAQATRTTLMGFAGLEKCEPGKLFMLRPEVKLQFEVTGVIQMSASRFNGSMMVSFPAKTLLKIVEKLLGEPTPEMTEDVAETAGEIINIIWGQTKKLLEADPSGFKSMIPTVIWGSGQKIGSSADAPMMVIPFETEVGDFFVMFAIQVQMHKLVV